MNQQPHIRWTLILSLFLCGVLVLLLAIAALEIIRSQEQAVRQQIASELSSIARLKVDQIAGWRRERLNEGAEILDRPLLRTFLKEWLSDPQQADETVLLAELRGLQRNDNYSDVLIIDRAGNILLSATGVEGNVGSIDALEDALHSGEPVLSELHTGAYSPTPHTSTFVLLSNATGEPSGAVVLITDAQEFLFPLVQSWPTASETAETLLVRREGDDVLFLNDLRHHADAALVLRRPISEPNLPAAMVARGIYGTVEAKDYRGVDVIADLRPVPDSEWFLVTKIDSSEVLAGWSQIISSIVLLAVGIASLIGMGVLLIWQNQRRQHVERLLAAERAQHARDLRYRTIVQSIGDGVIVTNAQGIVRLLNPVAEMLTGWSNEEAQGRPLEEVFRIVNEENRQPVANPALVALQKGRIVGLANHTLLIDRYGVEHPIADAASPILDEQTEAQGAVLIFRDQSAERAAQRALAESEARNSAMIKAIPDLIFQLDHEYRFVDCWVNDAARLLAPTDQFLGKRTAEVLPLEVAEGGARAIDRALQTGEMQLFEYSLETPTGLGWYEQQIAPISADQVIAITRDISDQKRSQQVMQIRLTLLEYAIDHTLKELLTKTLNEICQLIGSPIGFYLFVDPNQRTLSLQAWSTRTAHESFPIEAEGQRYALEQAGVWADAVHLRQPIVHNERVSLPQRKTLPESHAYLERELVVPIVRGDQVVAILGVGNKSSPYMEEDVRHVSYIADVAWEIVERKRIEEAQHALQEKFIQSQKLETVGQLAGGIAHDFNNMLAVILMRCEMALQQVTEGTPLHRHLTEIQATGQRSAELTRQLLGFARKQMISPRVLDLNQTISDMAMMLNRLIGENITLQWQPGAELWPVKIDPSQVSQIVVNLCVNARDAIEGAGIISIQTENITVDALHDAQLGDVIPDDDIVIGDYVLLTISDNGSGMGKEVLSHVFEPFFTTKEVGKGTGLGLATVYGIVRQNQGHIRVYSEPGLGTTFHIYLPRHVHTLAEPSETPVADVPRGNGESVLLVEDEPIVLSIIAESLQRLGYRVLSAATPGDALSIAAKHDNALDLLITDVIMPTINGRQLAEQVAMHHPHIKRIFMSGYPVDIISHRAVLNSKERFLPKPFTLMQLATTVRAVLDIDSSIE